MVRDTIIIRDGRLVGAFSVITNIRMELFEALAFTTWDQAGPGKGGDCTKTTSTLHGDTWQGGRELGGQVEARGGRQLLRLGAKESSTEKKMSTIIGLSMDILNILTWKDDVEPVYESVHPRLLHGRQGPAPRLAALGHAVQRLCTVLLSGGERARGK